MFSLQSVQSKLPVFIFFIFIAAFAGCGSYFNDGGSETDPGAADNAYLSDLSVSEGILSPDFNKEVFSYSTDLPYDTSSIEITPNTESQNATITVNGQQVTSGTKSDPINLDIGSNTISIIVTAEDGSTIETYTIEAERNDDINANLLDLSISGGIISPAFNKEIISYSADLHYSISSITITPNAESQNATITVNGQPVTSETASGPINLNIGSNTINIIVTAGDNFTTKTYTIIAVRNDDDNAYLLDLSVSINSISPNFNREITTYTVNYLYSISSITVTPTKESQNATVTVNGQPVTSGSESNPISLDVGSNTISIIVTAGDNTTTKTYNIMASRGDVARWGSAIWGQSLWGP